MGVEEIDKQADVTRARDAPGVERSRSSTRAQVLIENMWKEGGALNAGLGESGIFIQRRSNHLEDELRSSGGVTAPP